MKKSIITFLLIGSVNFMNAQNILYDTARIESMLESPKDSINNILNSIACKHLEQIGFINKYSSSINLKASYSFSGLNYIYLFNLILSYPENYKAGNYDTSLISTSRKDKYQLYKNCIIMKKNKASYNMLTCKDVSFLQKYLKKWWGQNEKLSIEEIKNNWIKQMPLSKLGYVWQ